MHSIILPKHHKGERFKVFEYLHTMKHLALHLEFVQGILIQKSLKTWWKYLMFLEEKCDMFC